MQNSKNLDSISDEQLVKELQAGSEEAFNLLFERYRPRIAAFSKYICKNEDQAEETCQEAFIKAFQSIRQFKGQSSFTTWLHTIAKNLCWSRKRKVKAHPVESLDTAAFGEKITSQPRQIRDWSQQPDEVLMSKEISSVIDEAIKKLPQDYRAVLVMKDMEELSNEEISKILKLSVPAVKSRLHRARLFVRQKIDRYFQEN